MSSADALGETPRGYRQVPDVPAPARRARAARARAQREGQLPPARRRALQRFRGEPRRVLTAMWLLADAGLVALIASGLAARVVRPDVWWWPQAAALTLPHAAVVAVPVALSWAVGALQRRRAGRPAGTLWVGFALHAGLTAVALGRFAGGDPPRLPPADGRPDVLRVMTLNAGAASSHALLAGELAAQSPDLAALQETGVREVVVSTPGEPERTALAGTPPVLPFRDGGYRPAPPDRPLSPTELVPLPVFARTNLTPSRVVSLGYDPDAGVVARTTLMWRGRRVALYNVHLRSFGPIRPWQSAAWQSQAAWSMALAVFRGDLILRAAEAERLRTMLEAETLPFLVVGDLNTTPHQWAYAHVARGLTDALGPPGWLDGTYPDSQPLVRIDVVLASPEWSVEAAWVGPRGLSDHRAVHARIRLIPADGRG